MGQQRFCDKCKQTVGFHRHWIRLTYDVMAREDRLVTHTKDLCFSCAKEFASSIGDGNLVVMAEEAMDQEARERAAQEEAAHKKAVDEFLSRERRQGKA